MAVVYSKVLLFDPPLIYTAPDTGVFGAVSCNIPHFHTYILHHTPQPKKKKNNEDAKLIKEHIERYDEECSNLTSRCDVVDTRFDNFEEQSTQLRNL